jgi:hypothetical protein
MASPRGAALFLNGPVIEEYLRRVWGELIGRVSGPLTFRLVLQPLTAAFLATRAAVKDARAGRPAYGWAILTDAARRHALLQEGWREIAKVFCVAVVIDLIYEIIVFHKVYPGQSLIVAAILALLPYPLFLPTKGRCRDLICLSRDGFTEKMRRWDLRAE